MFAVVNLPIDSDSSLRRVSSVRLLTSLLVVQCGSCTGMAERQNTVVCCFDLTRPKITAYDIHEWIFAVLRIPEHNVHVIQIDGIRRQVCITLAVTESVLALLRDTVGQAEYKYPSGELSIVNVAMAGLGTKRVRIANLPPEVSNETRRATLAPFGRIVGTQNERWSKEYRYAVDNGVRQVTMVLSRNASFHLTVAGQRVLLSYEEQPATCYGCGEPEHMYQGCPARHKLGSARTVATALTYAAIVTASTALQEEPVQVTETGGDNGDNEGPAPSTVGKLSLAGGDTSATSAQVEATDTLAIGAELPTPDRPGGAVADTSQCSAFGDTQQRMETSGPKDDLPMRRNEASRILSSKPRAPVHYAAGRRRIRKATMRMELWRTRMIRQYTEKGNGLKRIYDIAQNELKG